MVLYNKPEETYWDNQMAAATVFGTGVAAYYGYAGAKLLQAYMAAKTLGIIGNTGRIVRFIAH